MKEPALFFYRRLGDVCKIDDHIIGADKFGQFIAQEYTYFKIIHINKHGLTVALRYGIDTESSYFGLHTTGIYSYADLVANFQGFRFWNFLRYRHGDPLADDKRGLYIKLIDGSWHQIRRFDWRYYVDSVWDEAVNQNSYRSEDFGRKINNVIQAHNHSMKNAPLALQGKILSNNLFHKYGTYVDWILNPRLTSNIKSF